MTSLNVIRRTLYLAQLAVLIMLSLQTAATIAGPIWPSRTEYGRTFVTNQGHPALQVFLAGTRGPWIGFVGEELPGTHWVVNFIGFFPQRVVLVDPVELRQLFVEWRDGTAIQSVEPLSQRVEIARPPPSDWAKHEPELPGTFGYMLEQLLEAKICGLLYEEEKAIAAIGQAFPESVALATAIAAAVKVAPDANEYQPARFVSPTIVQSERSVSMERNLNSSGEVVVIPHFSLTRSEPVVIREDHYSGLGRPFEINSRYKRPKLR